MQSKHDARQRRALIVGQVPYRTGTGRYHIIYFQKRNGSVAQGWDGLFTKRRDENRNSNWKLETGVGLS